MTSEVCEEEGVCDGPEKFLLKTKYLTDPGSRDTDELRAWASSAPEMKDVSLWHSHKQTHTHTHIHSLK